MLPAAAYRIMSASWQLEGDFLAGGSLRCELNEMLSEGMGW